jgi:hypothetical protein
MSQSPAASVPPAQIMMNYVLGNPVSRMIGAAAELGIVRELGAGPKSAEQVARAVGTQPDTTYRLLRALGALGVLEENAKREFSLTPVGECLLPDRPGSFDALAKLNNSAWITGAYAEIVHAVRTGGSGFDKHHGKGFFDWMAEHPAEQQLFGQAMSTFSGMEVELVLGAFDFSHARHVVDVGGGHGLLLSRVLEAAPEARGTLFDRAEVAARAKSTFVDPKIRARCEVMGGDFFELVPRGGDVYLLKHILHDWDDERASAILAAVSKAMSPGARVLVIEQGIAAPGVPNPGKVLDLVMLMLLEGGRERTAAEHAALFERAGIRFQREITTPGPITLFEGVRT